MSNTVLAMIELSSSPRPAAIVACSNCCTTAVTGAGTLCSASVETTFIDGEVFFDKAEDQKRRAQKDQQRAELERAEENRVAGQNRRVILP